MNNARDIIKDTLTSCNSSTGGDTPREVREIFKLSAESLWEYFKDYDLTPQGCYTHRRKFQRDFEVMFTITHFKKFFSVKSLRSGSPVIRNRSELIALGTELDKWQTEIYEMEKSRTLFDLNHAGEFRGEDGVVIIFEPKKGCDGK